MVMEKLTLKDLTDADLDWSEIFHLFYIAKKYDVRDIEAICRRAVRDWIKVEDVLFVYESLHGLDEEELVNETFDFITESAHIFFIYICQESSVIHSNANLGVRGQGLLNLSGDGDTIEAQRLISSLFYSIRVC